MQDIETFKKSPCFMKLMQFVYECQKSIESKAISETKFCEKFEKIQAFLLELEKLLEQIPPL